MALKVIGAGGPRTGTASLKVALETLGFGKCYHMEWLFNHPDQLPYWHELFDTGSTDFDALFDGFQSTVDFPGYQHYPILLEKYPDAKVILTERDPEEWYESIKHTVHAAIPRTLPQKLDMMKRMLFSSRFRKLAQCFKLVGKYLWKEHYHDNFHDKEATLKIYTEFNEEVKRAVPKEQLLIYNVSEGWGPLCEFLKVPVPDEPFAHKNKREDFKEKISQLKKTGGKLELK